MSHLKKRGWMLLSGVLPSFASWFLPRKSKRIIFNSSLNEHYNFNSKYLFEYFLKNHPSYECRFVINDKQKRKHLIKAHGDFFISSHGISNIIFILMARTWVTSSFETPIGGFTHAFRRVVFHLGHGAPLKNIGLLEKNLSLAKKVYYRILRSNFNYLSSTSDLFSPIWSKATGQPLERIIPTGQARCDRLTQNSQQITRSKKVLYAPTWRPWGELSLFPFPDFCSDKLQAFLEKEDIEIYLRVHPINKNVIPPEIESLTNIHVLGNEQETEINDVLSTFDTLITDYSSIYVDFVLTAGKIIFLPYDRDLYDKEIGFAIDYDQHTPGAKPESLQDFLNSLLENSFPITPEHVTPLHRFSSDFSKRCAEFILKQI